MTRSRDVAIIGGGIGGLTLASNLAQRSISAMVFEQDNELRQIGAGRWDRLHNARVLLDTAGMAPFRARNNYYACRLRSDTDLPPPSRSAGWCARQRLRSVTIGAHPALRAAHRSIKGLLTGR